MMLNFTRTIGNQASRIISTGLVRKTCRSLSVPASSGGPVAVDMSEGGKFATVTLARPEKHNALSPDTMEGIVDAFTGLANNPELRGVFLTAEGKSFCAGGDLKHMRATADFTPEQNEADAMRLSGVFDSIYRFPRPVIALIGGNVYGGGLGVVSACDAAFSVASAKFAFTELKLGVIPATIAPYVLARIGAPAARRYFLTAESFSAPDAVRIGLLDEMVDSVAELDEVRSRLETAMLATSPAAAAACKELIFEVSKRDVSLETREWTASVLARTRDSPDGREGMSAFIERRKPRWQE